MLNLKSINKKHSLIFGSLIVLFILFFQSTHAHARQDIITIPNSEVLPAGDMIFKDSNRYTPNETEGQFRITPSLTVGTGCGTEVSAGAATTIQDKSLVRGDFTAKKVFFLGPSTRLSVGTTISPYMTEVKNADTFAFAHVSQRIKKQKPVSLQVFI